MKPFSFEMRDKMMLARKEEFIKKVSLEKSSIE